MKKFFAAVYFITMSLLVISLSGCGGSSSTGSGGETNKTKAAQSRRMIVTSPIFKRDGTYNLFRGDKVSASISGKKYYLAPVARGTENITMNLEYANPVSEDLPFMITDSDGYTVLFFYNPDGTGQDTETSGVFRTGGGTQKLKYTNLSLSNASVELEDDGVIDIVLSANGSATVSGEAAPVYDLVWHADPQHPAQYWTYGMSGTTEYDEDAYEAEIEAKDPAYGVYIARDVRYTPNTLEFTTSQTATKDGEAEYVVRYDFTAPAVRAKLAEISADYGIAYSSDQYIFATLPQQVAGMGGGNPPDGGQGGPGGNPPDGGQGGNPPSGGPGGNPPNMSSAATDTSSIPAFATMTHSASDAYNNPVLHITTPGVYRLSGEWHGQIWIETPKAKVGNEVGLILSGVEVSCDVAPALVFYKVYKWAENGGQGYDSKDVLADNDLWKNLDDKMISTNGYYEPGAIVEIADGTTNTFTGANVYRILELCPKIDDDTDLPKYTGSGIGTDISEQEKMYKLDGAFHSRRTMVIGGASSGTGKLNITSTTCEGLDSEMHMLVTGGNITVTAPDDGINVNEDYVSVFVMNDGNLTISSTGGDGIDSNGWISFKGGTLNITAGNQRSNSAGEAGLDAENGTYIYDASAYTWSATTGGGDNGGGDNGGGDNGGGDNGGGDNSNSDSNSNQNQNQNEQTGNDDDDSSSNTGTHSILPVTESKEEIKDENSNVVLTFTLFPSSDTIKTDTEGDRDIPSSGETFPLVHQVNDFAGIR